MKIQKLETVGWVARDASGLLYFYENKPSKQKSRGVWSFDNGFYNELVSAVLPDVKWGDKNPTPIYSGKQIEDMLKNIIHILSDSGLRHSDMKIDNVIFKAKKTITEYGIKLD